MVFLKSILAVFLLFQYTLSVDVDVVLFNVSVLDKGGNTVSGLALDNFHIYEDGREQTIKIFQPEDTPATVGLVIDNSGSMQHRRQDAVNAALAFVGASHPEDEMFVVDFNRKAWLALPDSMPFTTNRNQLRETLSKTSAFGTTALYDALDLALDHLKKGTRQRKALVLLSDGSDNSSLSTLDDVLRRAQQSSATIYCIGIYDDNQKDKNPRVLREIAKVTGGEAYFPHQSSDLNEIWPRIAGKIRGQYTIGYLSTNPSRDGAYRRVKITAVDKRGKPLEIRTRSGYAPSVPQPDSK